MHATAPYRRLITLLILLAIALAACAAPGGAPTTEEPSAVTVEPSQPPAEIITESPPLSAATATQESESAELPPIVVEDVRVEVGVGSPIPVDVFVSGTWPHLCAQLVDVRQSFSGSQIEISLLSSAPEPDCPPDHLGLAFRFVIPLNMLSQPAGTYSVVVNGVQTSFDWSGSASEAPNTPAGGDQTALRPVSIDDVRVEIGVGSPIPVDVVISASWPDLCAQLAQISQTYDSSRFTISMMATPAAAGCTPGAAGAPPMRIAIPLNMAELPLGSYTVSVNGVATAFDWNAKPGTPPEAAFSLAYLGPDGNVWVLDTASGDQRQVTQDATAATNADTPSVSYSFLSISSDGQLVAFRRDAGTPIEAGMQYEIGLQVYDLVSGETTQVVADRIPAGFDWQPGTHSLTYGLGTDPGYFTARGEPPSPELATGLWNVDLDTGEKVELVTPQGGYSLILPQWSPDGRYVGFDEVINMEGRGNFGYFDTLNEQFVEWNEPIGDYSWSPDSLQIAYDRLTYTATGEEKIYLKALPQGDELVFSPDDPNSYDIHPAFSPDGSSIAFLTGTADLEDQHYTLFVQQVAGGEPISMGVFESVYHLGWSPDGSRLVFSAGPYESQSVLEVDPADGSSRVLAQGSMPDVAGY